MHPLEGPHQANTATPTPKVLWVAAATHPAGGWECLEQSQRRVLLARLLAQGHGREALSFFLALSKDAILDLAVQFGLPTPHDRPLRRSRSPRAWSQSDFLTLFEGWFANWSAACIGERLGRSRGSIWYQARRLGLPKRDRKELHWPRPAVVDLPPAPSTESKKERLPKSWLVQGTDKALMLTSKRNGLEVDWAANIEAYVDIGWRAFSGQRPSRIAEAYGVSCGTITSQIWWLHAKSPKRHKDFVDHFDRERGQANAKAMGFHLRQCGVNSAFPYFYHRDEQIARRDKRNRRRSGLGF
jgi:hypothetical protein